MPAAELLAAAAVRVRRAERPLGRQEPELLPAAERAQARAAERAQALEQAQAPELPLAAVRWLSGRLP